MKKFKLEHWHRIAVILAIYDAATIFISYFLALWFYTDCSFSAIHPSHMRQFMNFAPINILLCLGVFAFLRLYRSIWRFASYNEMMRIISAVMFTSLLHWIVATYVLDWGGMPTVYYIVGTALHFSFAASIRFAYRIVLVIRKSRRPVSNGRVQNVMLIGAGNAGQVILRDVNHGNHGNHSSDLRICCIIDDNSNKWGRYIDGVPVVGGRDQIMASVSKYSIEHILLAIPSATALQKKEILDICKETSCKIKSLPGVSDLVHGKLSASDMRDVAVEDLLGREPIRVDMHEIYDYITGKVILVTGGGGSIGSELCRQIAAHDPKLLIVLDVYENNAYDIEQELLEKYPGLHLKVLIGSVRDSRRLTQIFEQYRPEIVYHAAAHKHVPLMETSPCESIKNNVIGTYKTAYAALIYGCKRFVLISTDKAVNPTNIMGASKRLCEMVVQSFDNAVKSGKAKDLPMLFTHHIEDEDMPHSVVTPSFHTEFVAVRFGNVLGSNGSVIPLFKKQIAAGGPVKVTHPDIIRYFMTIPEAVSLVMQAGTYANGGEIFVLDMGVPVKIDDLARNLIKLSGFEPDVDIPIVYTGLRPGEKLYEEKLMAEEGLQKTPNALIHIGCPIPFDTDAFLISLTKLMNAAYENDERIVQMVADIVSTYHPNLGATESKDETFKKLHKEAVTAH